MCVERIPKTARRRLLAAGLALMSLSLPLSACHVHGHHSPGHVKHVVDPGKVKAKTKSKGY